MNFILGIKSEQPLFRLSFQVSRFADTSFRNLRCPFQKVFTIEIGSVFCQKFTQVGAWGNKDWFSTFGDTQTTLCKNQRTYTCMTSLGKTVQCINMGHMFKKRTFWDFLCITDVHKLGACYKVFGDLEKLFLSLEPNLQILCASQMAGGINLQLPRLLKSQTTLCQILLSWLRYTRLYSKFCTCFIGWFWDPR